MARRCPPAARQQALPTFAAGTPCMAPGGSAAWGCRTVGPHRNVRLQSRQRSPGRTGVDEPHVPGVDEPQQLGVDELHTVVVGEQEAQRRGLRRRLD
mmetsp:Transcript_3803/g.10825  ORF Transcript_3803/g.10825 Transcript_3803/m.10825 type:complete len:97 (-) Transcript_3803:488-778(-)